MDRRQPVFLGPEAPFSSVDQFPSAPRGAQGGGVRESPEMEKARTIQALLGAAGTAGGWAMTGAGNTFGLPIAMGGAALWDNAGEANIRDVWGDKLRTLMQRQQKMPGQ